MANVTDIPYSNTSNLTSVELAYVIYSSEAERVLSMLFITVCALFTIISQSLVIITIIISPSLHNAHFYIICGYCVADLTAICMSAPNYLAQFIMGGIPELYCRVLSTCCIVVVLGTTYHTGLVAYERYVFFCCPYVYSQHMSVMRTIAAMAFCYIVPLVMGVTTEIYIGRSYHASVIACNLPDSAVQSILQFVIILLPSAAITIYSLVRVWRLAMQAQVHPGLPNVSNDQITPIQQAKKGLRMVLLLSGTFWGTIIPGYIVRIMILNMGYSWEDLDTRRFIVPAVSMRVVTFIYSTVSSAANPIIYYYSRKDLREATLKILHRNRVHPLN